jgi:hypothetical protein
MVPVSRQDAEFSLALRPAVSPNSPDQRPFIAQPAQSRLVAAVGQLKASRTLADPAHECSPCTDPPWSIEVHHRVCALEPKLKCGVVVAVENPLVAGDQVALRLAPLVLRRLHLARFPEVDVKMDDGKASLGRERSRERALARSGHPSDHDASSDRNPGWDVPYRSKLREALIRHQCILPDTGWTRRHPAYPSAGAFLAAGERCPWCRTAPPARRKGALLDAILQRCWCRSMASRPQRMRRWLTPWLPTASASS